MSNGHLSNEQILRAAVGHILDGIDQHKLAAVMGVNQGRINEAVKAVEWAIANHKTAYLIARGKAHVTLVNGEDDE